MACSLRKKNRPKKGLITSAVRELTPVARRKAGEKRSAAARETLDKKRALAAARLPASTASRVHASCLAWRAGSFIRVGGVHRERGSEA